MLAPGVQRTTDVIYVLRDWVPIKSIPDSLWYMLETRK